MSNRAGNVKLFCIFISMIVMVMIFETPGEAWEKMGVFEGHITAIHKTTNSTTTQYFVATSGSGVYYSETLTSWEQRSTGLEELEIVAITSDPQVPSRLYCASASIVYYSDNSGSSWSRFYQIPASTQNQPRITSLYTALCNTTRFLYVGTYGNGLWRVNVSSGVWAQPSGTFPARVLCLDGSGIYIFAGTEYDSTNQTLHPGGIWRIDDCQDYSGSLRYGQYISWPSISVLDDPGSTYAIILAGSAGQGIAFSTNSGSSFMPYCQAPPFEPAPDGTIQSLDFLANSSTSSFYGLAGTENGLYCLLGNIFTSCSDGYSHLGFYGNVSAVGVFGPYAGLFGTRGKGLFVAGDSSTNKTICEAYTPISRTQIPHQHVNRIAVSPNYATDSTIFLASRSEGIYKSIGTGPGGSREFTRSFCHPNAYSPVDILSLDLTPGYDNLGSAWSSNLSNDKVLMAGSNGYGVFLSRDGGASWYIGNGGEMPLDAVVMDVEYSPNARTDGIAYAAVWDRGLFMSTDMGISWAQIDCSSTLHIWDIELPSDYNHTSNRTIWAATSEGMHEISYSSDWSCVHRGLIGNPTIPAWRVAVAISGATPLVFFGTPANGVILGSFDGNGDWTETQLADSYLPSSAKVKDLALSPWFSSGNEFVDLYAIVYRPGSDGLRLTRFYPSQGFTNWVEVGIPTLGLQRFTSIELGPDYAPGNVGPIYLGHPFLGMFSRASNTSGWLGATGYYAYPHEVTATAVDPVFPNLILSGTADMGMFISYDGGDSACPFGDNLDHWAGTEWQTTSSITTIAITDSTQILLNEGFTSPPTLYGWTIEDGDSDSRSWFWQDGFSGYGTPPTACHTDIFSLAASYMQVDSDCAGSSYTLDEGLITPAMDCTNFLSVTLEFDHYFRLFSGNERAVVYVFSEWTAPSWIQVAEYTSSTNNADHVALDISQYTIGSTAVQIKFAYENAHYDWYWFIDNVKVWGYVDIPATRTAVLGTEGYGIYTTSYSTYADTHDAIWQPASSPANELGNATISKISYLKPNEDLRASVSDNPYVSIAAPSFVSADLGASWTPVYGGLIDGTLLNDIVFDLSPTKHSRDDTGFPFRKGDPGKAQTLTMWGCSSGSKTPPYKIVAPVSPRAGVGGTAGAYRYDVATDTWEIRNGDDVHVLSEELYYSTILSTTSARIFIGGWTDATQYLNFNGLWRSNDAGSSWYQVNAGLESQNAKQITSLLETDEGDLLLGVNDSTDGGVFYSDSQGYAWVRIDDFTGERGVNALSRSKTIPAVYYASMVSDGTQRALDLTETVITPVAEFLMDGNPATLADKTYPDETDYQKWASTTTGYAAPFTSVSAGQTAITSYEWDFDNDGTYDATGAPTTHIFTTGGIKTVTLRLNGDNAITRSHKIMVYDTSPPPIPDNRDGGADMLVEKGTIDGSSILVTWDDSCDPFRANIIYGQLGTLSGYAISGSECAVEASATWNVGSLTNIWFVVVSDNGDDTEGSWGEDSIGTERSLGVASCDTFSDCPLCTKVSTGTCD